MTSQLNINKKIQYISLCGGTTLMNEMVINHENICTIVLVFLNDGETCYWEAVSLNLSR